jgi:DNA invertase Pin-like site-specific DNA recombinase
LRLVPDVDSIHSQGRGAFYSERLERMSSMARSYRKAEHNPIDPYKAQPLPLGRPVAVYYRQSSEGQVGNISTTLQTVDMVDHLIKQGWQREQVIMIDMDAGISGTKKIKERPGMSYLYDLIEESTIGLVASQDVDRFFRDMAQIETNIFIDACRRNNVQVLTPTFVYDFAHPTQGRYHMQMFRDQAQRAADFLEFHIKGRLHQSRRYLSLQGQWMGHTIPLGYMVDVRERLPDGGRNEHFRKYVPFPVYADVVRAYFTLFKQFKGNLQQTYQNIEQHGPFLPEFDDHPAPPGYLFRTNLEKRSRITGKLMLSHYGLRHLLMNAAYIGCWAVNRVIVERHNHEPILPLDLFMYAFNRLSQVTLDGDPNPHYTAQRPWVRHDKKARPKPPPTYSGALFTTDTPEGVLRKLGTHWEKDWPGYVYAVHHNAALQSVWKIGADKVDQQIDRLLMERLCLTTIDESAWQQAVATTQDSAHLDIRRVQHTIRSAENA